MSTDRRPNIILITTDQQRWDTVGVNGNEMIRTPHLDALAAQGINFQRAFVQNPVCIPSRACMQTGRYPHQHGVQYMETEIDLTPGLPPWEVTFMERLQQAGYRTGATGKMHMMPPKGFHFQRLTGGKGQRWTRSEGSSLGPGPLGPTYASWLETRAPAAYERLYEQRRQPEYSRHLGAIRHVLPLEQYVDYWVTEEALEFLRYPGSKPFFLWCGFCGPHGPVDPPAPYDDLYPFDTVPLPKTRSDHPQTSPKGLPACPWKGDETIIRRWVAYYWGLVSLIDDMVGRLVSLLEERNLLDHTLILFTSDHGEMAGDYNMFGKGNFYEEVIRVPLIIHPPASQGNAPVDRSIGDLVEVTDLAPTILDYAGIDRPDEMPARSLRSLLEGRPGGRESVLCEYVTNDQQRRGKCVRTQQYKYVFWGLENPAELYDLHEDPDELRNLAEEPAAAGVRQHMQELLLNRLQESEQVLHRDATPDARDLKTWLD